MIKIYALINPITNAVFYIGASVNPKLRLQQHLYDGKTIDCFKSTQIKETISSGECVELLILDNCEIEEASFWEEFYIELFQSFGFTLPQMKCSSYSETYKNKKVFNCESALIRIDKNILVALEIINDFSSTPPHEFIRTAILEKMRRYFNKTLPHYESLKASLFNTYNIPYSE